jgi:7-keto-8-aminopelargonate synthetase-like enzyme
VVQFDSHIAQRLAALEAAGLRRRTREISGPQGTHLSIEGRSVLSLSSNNYLGLAGHPDLMRVGAEALAAYGAGSGASRLAFCSPAAMRAISAWFRRLLVVETLSLATPSITRV